MAAKVGHVFKRNLRLGKIYSHILRFFLMKMQVQRSLSHFHHSNSWSTMASVTVSIKELYTMLPEALYRPFSIS